MNTKYLYIAMLAAAMPVAFSSCNDYLDEEPQSVVTPESYFTEASQLQAYVDENYSSILPSVKNNSYGIYGEDAGTDNQLDITPNSDLYENGHWKVPQKDADNWDFENIYRCNYFFSEVLPKFGDDLSGSQNTISGNLQNIRHYIGEMYFMRAYEYFSKLMKYGDFPIITTPLKENRQELSDASKRMPCNEVARFILSDLDKAITLMDGTSVATTRISRDLALTFKSRVALYEGTWLKYFKGTAFVPGNSEWAGAKKDYNKDYQFPTGSIDAEINWFLDQAMTSSKDVAERYKNSLTENTGSFQNTADEPANPYFDMYASDDVSSYKEVLLWRDYGTNQACNDVALAANSNNFNIGVTRSFVQNFLMADGTPVYCHGSYADGDGYYKGDKSIENVRTNRDTRLSVFLKSPGQNNILTNSVPGLSNLFLVEPNPDLLNTMGNGNGIYTTGYTLRKGGARDSKFCEQLKGYVGIVMVRSVEALLNYMEASYEREGQLDATAREYWQIIRRRAGVSEDIDKTIQMTDMQKEAENDWAAYSAGTLLTDKTLYNIRRERRCEFIGDGMRTMDLHRWRAMDQLITKAYIPEGIHLYNTPLESYYADKIIADGSAKANLSSKDKSEYVRPFQRTTAQLCYNGYTWSLAHYLNPLPYNQFQLTAADGKTVSESPLYQNPYWPLEPNKAAEK